MLQKLFMARFPLYGKKKIKMGRRYSLVTPQASRRVFKVKSTICFVGSVYGYSQVENYDSLLTVLRDLSDEDKQQLVQKIQVMIAQWSKLNLEK